MTSCKHKSFEEARGRKDQSCRVDLDSVLIRPSQKNMPKLKVPGESLKAKDRVSTSRRSKRKRHLSKDSTTDLLSKEKKTRLNGLPPRSPFYDIYGPSDDESWEGFTILEVCMNEVEEEDEEEKEEGLQAMDTCSSTDPPSPLSSSSSLSPPSSPRLATPLPNRTGVAVRKRGVRCMECPSCLRKDDCGKCQNCKDKPKFGGPGTRKQACIHRKCCNLLRDVPLKQAPVKRPGDYISLPPAKRSSVRSLDAEGSGRGDMIPSLLRPRRSTTLRRADEEDEPVLQLHWPDSPSDYIGFPIYSISPVQFSLCVRCGSEGLEGILTCQICCQPFHWYCVDLFEPSTAPYTCSRCVACAVCGKPNECTQCSSCKLWFHKTCLLGHASDPPIEGMEKWRCAQCCKCISCHSNTPAKMEGFESHISSLLAPNPMWSNGFLYCTMCYELKKKGNSCPVCGECYLDNDFDSKMVQCGQCDSWVHSRCDDMTDEEYEILSDLPESVEYMCALCVPHDAGPPGWKIAIIQFKTEAYDKLLACLSKSLGDLWPNDFKIPVPLPSVVWFISRLNEQLRKCGKTVRTGSKQHRLLYNVQQDYDKDLQDLFPWFSADLCKETEEQPQVTPTKKQSTINNRNTIMNKWPSEISHDHNYLSNGNQTLIKSEIDEEHDSGGMRTRNEMKERRRSDPRQCILCTVKGDQIPTGAGRLIPCGGVDEWVHVNCALWSAEVYEEDTGHLYSVHSAIARGQRLRCDGCNILGATVGCCYSHCSSNFHFMCARNNNCIFLDNKEVFCKQHSSFGDKKEHVKENEMRVDRCVLIYTDLERPGRKLLRTLNPAIIRIMIGSLCVEKLGTLTSLSDTGDPSILLPHRYCASCDFWSVTHPQTKTHYSLTIIADPPEEELLPLAPPKMDNSTISPDHLDWPCVSTEVSADERCSLWSSLSPVTHVILTPKLIQAAYALLKVSEGLPVSDALKAFKIPKRSISKTEEVQKPMVVEKLDSLYESLYQKGEIINSSGISFELSSEDGSSWKDSDLNRLWNSVICELQEARKNLDLPFIPFTEGVARQFGLSQPLVLQLLEQLPSVEKCSRHEFHYHRPPKLSSWQEVRTTLNPTGSARSEKYSGIRSIPDMFSFLMSDHRPSPPDIDQEALEMVILQAECQGNNQRQGQNDLPVAMRYRNCQRTYKESVNVFQSRIHGLGLFCTQDIDAGDTVIEYAGTVIRSLLTDKREKYYESRGIGCYMFRIDNDDVVDATMSGNMARFINHACEPNCYSKVIAVDGQKKIMIFALRRIVPGEELTYDYKFPIEDAKIPCKCGSARCRKTLN